MTDTLFPARIQDITPAVALARTDLFPIGQDDASLRSGTLDLLIQFLIEQMSGIFSDGEDGKSAELRVSAGKVQWRQAGTVTWIDLFTLTDVQGPKGDKGDPFAVDAQGNISERGAYNAEDEGFSFLALDEGLLYFRQGITGWSAGIPFGKGDKGDQGDPGIDGDDGLNVELGRTVTHLEWRYAGTGGAWTTLVALEDLRGPAGSDASVTQANITAAITNAEAFRTALGLGNASLRSVGTTAGTVAAGDDSRIVGAAQKSELAAPDGSGGLLILHKRSNSGTFARTLRGWGAIGGEDSVLHWVDPDLDAEILGGTSMTNIRDQLAAALAAMDRAFFPEGAFRVNGILNVHAGQRIDFQGYKTVITQGLASTPTFRGHQADGLVMNLNRGRIYGEGTFGGNPGGPWTGNTSSEDRGIWLTDSDYVSIDRAHILRCGHAGILLNGCKFAMLTFPKVVGTHRLGSVIKYPGEVGDGLEANYQMGISFVHSAAYGPCEGFEVVAPDISGTAQGILDEWEDGPHPAVPRTVLGGIIHDIPGQHGFYIQSGNLSILGTALEWIALSGVKCQLGGGNVLDMENIVAKDICGYQIGSQLFEVAVVANALAEGKKIRSVKFEGRAKKVARLMSSGDNVEDLEAHIAGEDIFDAMVQLQGGGIKRHRYHLTKGRNCGGSALRSYATAPEDIEFHTFNVRNVNKLAVETYTATAGQTFFRIRAYPQTVKVNGVTAAWSKGSGGFVLTTPASAGDVVTAEFNAANVFGGSAVRLTESGSGSYRFYDFDARGDAATMYAGLFVETGSPSVEFFGEPVILNASDYSIRASGGSVKVPGDFQSDKPILGGAFVSFKGEAKFSVVSTASTTVLRIGKVPVGTSMVEVKLISRNADNSQQKAVILRRLFTFDGTTVTAVAATAETVIAASGSFAGTYTLNAGNSGTTGADTFNVLVVGDGYEWEMVETITSV
jgi:hypothetical protein